MVFISTLVVQLVIAFFHSQIVHAIHAGVWFHAGVLPAVVQSTLDQLGVGRVLGHGGERQHVLHLQHAGLSTSMSVEIRATFIVTNPVLVHGPVRVFLLGLGQGSLGLSVSLGCVGCENYVGRFANPGLHRVCFALLANLMAEGLVSHGTIIVSAYLAPQEPLHRVVRRSLVVHPELVNFHPLFVFKELESFLVIMKCRESSSLPLERSGFLVFADRQGHALLGVQGHHLRWSLRFSGLLGLDHWQDQCPEVVDALQQAGIVTSKSQRLMVVRHLLS